MSKLDQISAFIQVVELHSFAAAAKKLKVSTAAISRKISLLETDLGVQLLTRSTRHLALTEMGMLYYQECKTLLHSLQETENRMAGAKEEASGVLHIMANRYFALEFIIPRLAQFLALHPKLRVHLNLAERFPDLMQENIDILFGVSIEGTPTLVRKKIAETEYLLCASPAYLKQYGTPEKPHDLHQHHYIAHSERKPYDVIHFKNEKELYIEPYLLLNDSLAMLDCAMKGMGIVRLHSYLVESQLRSKQLVTVLPNYHFEKSKIFLYYQQSRHLLPKIRKFIDFYVE